MPIAKRRRNGGKWSKEFEEHLKNHLNWPASKSEIVAACNNMSDVPAREKKWFAEAIPERKFRNAEEVLKVLATAEAQTR